MIRACAGFLAILGWGSPGPRILGSAGVRWVVGVDLLHLVSPQLTLLVLYGQT